MPVIHKFSIVRDGERGMKIDREAIPAEYKKRTYHGRTRTGSLEIRPDHLDTVIALVGTPEYPGAAIYTLDRKATDAEENQVDAKVRTAINAMRREAEEALHTASELDIALRHVWTED